MFKINTSGKKDGKGGIEALSTKSAPSKIDLQAIFASPPRSAIKRLPLELLKAPALANSPQAAQPCAKERRPIIRLNSTVSLKIPTVIRVMCVTLL